ncbi:hypothetical protein EDEG_01015 [Edhazardia aedis USNM 41457]|uniref:Uncharacterized protein n=1 Tax=Edhazardia aedis (strain USNM 41457) TaxID=1003232 RepID=J8ZYP1_EDHAE|nr:hypothetical protein EDEG_01015 [Edhazardia aedis USNM 41457]|eukprot:EJW04793.1 hypothetical protein EDEG_01015 [Edhazardia aedis USNM 41457]
MVEKNQKIKIRLVWSVFLFFTPIQKAFASSSVSTEINKKKKPKKKISEECTHKISENESQILECLSSENSNYTTNKKLSEKKHKRKQIKSYLEKCIKNEKEKINHKNNGKYKKNGQFVKICYHKKKKIKIAKSILKYNDSDDNNNSLRSLKAIEIKKPSNVDAFKQKKDKKTLESMKKKLNLSKSNSFDKKFSNEKVKQDKELNSNNNSKEIKKININKKKKQHRKKIANTKSQK